MTNQPSERCFACGKPLRGDCHLATALDDQTAQVGPDCFRKIEKAGLDGYQPPKGGPRLYTLGAKKTLNLESSLREMLSVYWGEGDGEEPPPSFIQRAQAALTPTA